MTWDGIEVKMLVLYPAPPVPFLPLTPFLAPLRGHYTRRWGVGDISCHVCHPARKEIEIDNLDGLTESLD